MLNTLKAIQNENVVNIKELQKSPSRYLRGLTRIQRGNKTLGYFLDQASFSDLIEDLEAVKSKSFIKSIASARASKNKLTLDQAKKRYGLR